MSEGIAPTIHWIEFLTGHFNWKVFPSFLLFQILQSKYQNKQYINSAISITV